MKPLSKAFVGHYMVWLLQNRPGVRSSEEAMALGFCDFSLFDRVETGTSAISFVFFALVPVSARSKIEKRTPQKRLQRRLLSRTFKQNCGVGVKGKGCYH